MQLAVRSGGKTDFYIVFLALGENGIQHTLDLGVVQLSCFADRCGQIHGTEAVHGSCGQLVSGDVVIFISNSGETSEMRSTVLAISTGEQRVYANILLTVGCA